MESKANGQEPNRNQNNLLMFQHLNDFPQKQAGEFTMSYRASMGCYKEAGGAGIG